ncbi:MAG: segregation/condensation protein A [bacterium]
MYSLKLDNFEGPFSVLLKMLEEKKLNIKDISLVAITGQFVQFVEEKANISPLDLANFLMIATHLLLLKSKAILPSLEFSEEEAEDIESLKEKLERYKKLEELISRIRQFLKSQKQMFPSCRHSGRAKVGFYPPENLSAKDLLEIYKDTINSYNKFAQKEVLPKESIQEIVSLEEKIQDLKNFIIKNRKEKFSYFIKDKKPIEIVVSFLALLELAKQESIYIYQETNFAEIEIKRVGGEGF